MFRYLQIGLVSGARTNVSLLSRRFTSVTAHAPLVQVTMRAATKALW